MKKTNRVILCCIVTALICACMIFMLAACDFNGQQSVPNNSNGNDTSNNTSNNNTDVDNDNNSGNNNQPSNPADKDEENPVDPDTGKEDPSEQLTERDYFNKFYEELPGVIETYYNANIATKPMHKISKCKIILYNNQNGTVYFNCEQQGAYVFQYAKSSELAGCNSYEELSNKLSTCSFGVDDKAGVSVQEEGLANEIFDYALEQQKVQEYMLANNLHKDDLELLNATEFESKTGDRISTITILANNKILSIKLGGVTGACATQLDYLNKLKNGRLRIVEVDEISDFAELEIAEDIA